MDISNNKGNEYCLAEDTPESLSSVSHFFRIFINRYLDINHIDLSPCVPDHWHMYIMLCTYTLMYLALFWVPAFMGMGISKGIVHYIRHIDKDKR